jgi:hypothetical protein
MVEVEDVVAAQPLGKGTIKLRPRDTAPVEAPESIPCLQLVTPDGTRDGKVVTGYRLFETVVRSLRLLWPVAALTLIPGFAQIGDKLYPSEVDEAPPSSSKDKERSERKERVTAEETHVQPMK